MNSPKTFFALFAVGCAFLFQPPTFAQTTTPALTPAQAIGILKTSDDLSQIVAALEVTTLDPAARQAAIDYLNQPMEDVRITNDWLTRQPQDLSLSDEERHEFMTPYWMSKPRRLSAANEAVVGGLHRYWAENAGAYWKFLNEHASPETFEVFKHFDQSIWAFLASNIEPTIPYAKNVKDNPALQKLYFNYLEEGMFDLQRVYYENANREGAILGVRNTRTGKFVHYQTPDQLVDFTKAEPIHEYSVRLVGGTGYLIFLGMRSAAADAELVKILNSDAYWNNPDLQIGFEPFSIPNFNRYEPNVIRLYQFMLSEPRYKDKGSLVRGLFEIPPMPALIDFDPRIHYDTWNEPLDAADPSVYPQLLAFIADAEKLNLSPDSQKLLDDSKAKILALQAAHASAKP